jgi:hypothetical protein
VSIDFKKIKKQIKPSEQLVSDTIQKAKAIKRSSFSINIRKATAAAVFACLLIACLISAPFIFNQSNPPADVSNNSNNDFSTDSDNSTDTTEDFSSTDTDNSTGDVIPDPPSNSLSFFFSSYEELNNALKDGSSQLHEVYIIEEQGRLFIELLDLFAEGNLSLKIPAYNDVPFELHEKTDWQKITLLSCERYDMPWIRYSCDYGGSCVAVGISYLDCLKVYEITPPEDINLFLDTVAPDSPGSENKKYRDKYPEICKDTYNETLNIKGTNVNAVVLEYTNGIVYRFVYDDLLVSVWAYDGGSIEQAFWEGFSLEEYAG